MMTVRNDQMKQLADQNPGQKNIAPCPLKKTWIEVQLLDQDQNPVPNAKYRLRLPDASISDGNLNDQGMVRIDGIIAGQCDISFPDIDGREWTPA
jgi:hypothetical protein